MRYALVIAAALCASACAPVATSTNAERVIPAGPAPTVLQAGFDRAGIEHDLLVTARERFGESNVRRALAAPTYLFAKMYHGMLPPPQPGAPPYQPPMALLIRENGQWLAAGRDGYRPANASKVAGIEALLADRSFWSTPDWSPDVCPDASATVMLLKTPARAEVIRRGGCGEVEMTERLVLLALDA